ncbi:hypothetical protein SAMN05216343_1137 [Oscillibacter sp. PC13]|nr:hypothetical protein SAMN05216343_1137 [Oscillibacter sp. PC13]
MKISVHDSRKGLCGLHRKKDGNDDENCSKAIQGLENN